MECLPSHRLGSISSITKHTNCSVQCLASPRSRLEKRNVIETPAYVVRCASRPLISEVALAPLTLWQGGKIVKQGWKHHVFENSEIVKHFQRRSKHCPQRIKYCLSPDRKRLRGKKPRISTIGNSSWLLPLPQVVSIACGVCPVWRCCLVSVCSYCFLHLAPSPEGTLCSAWGPGWKTPADWFSGSFSANFCCMSQVPNRTMLCYLPVDFSATWYSFFHFCLL